MNLLEAKEGKYKIISLNGGKFFKSRLLSLGFSEGSTITKLEDNMGLVRVKESSYGIGRGQCMKIEVEEVE